MKNIFFYKNYKLYLIAQFPTGQRTGRRLGLARALNCQTSLVSKVLNSSSHFTLEQARQICDFLNLTTEETHYLLLLVQEAKAGTQSLKEYFREQISIVQKRRLSFKHRLNERSKEISKKAHLKYYDSWIYSAIHITISIPRLQTIQEIADYLGASPVIVAEVLLFLEEQGLAIRKGDRFVIGPNHVHLSKDSPMISRHHTNWRLKALQAINHFEKDDLHYSGVISLSERDVRKIKEQFIQAIKTNLDLCSGSKEEVIYCMSADFFAIKR